MTEQNGPHTRHQVKGGNDIGMGIVGCAAHLRQTTERRRNRRMPRLHNECQAFIFLQAANTQQNRSDFV